MRTNYLRFSYYLLLLTILLLPWYIVRWQIFHLPTTLLELSVGLLTIVWLIELLWHRPKLATAQSAVRRHAWWLILMSVFGLAATIAVVVAPDLRAGLGIYKAYIIEPLVVTLIGWSVIVANPRRWQGVALALLLAGLEVAAVSLSQALFGWPNLAPAELAQGRASSFYNSANAVGLFLGPLVALSLGLMASRTLKGWLFWLLPLGSLLSIMAIGVSKSRGAWLGLVAVGVVFVVAVIYDRLKPRFLSLPLLRYLLMAGLLVYVIGSLSFVWWFNHPPHVANPYTRPGFSTLTVRQCLWQGSAEMLAAHPILGAGLAGFSQAYLSFATCDAEPLVYPHMLVLNFWSEMGLLGLVAGLAVMVWWLWQAADLVLRPDRPAAWLGWAMIAALVYWLVHGLVDVPYFKNDLSMEWWLLTCLLLTASAYIRHSAAAIEP
jgi:O-antigen ligase